MRVEVGYELAPLHGRRGGPDVLKPKSHTVFLNAEEAELVSKAKELREGSGQEVEGEVVSTEDENEFEWTGTAQGLGDIGLIPMMLAVSRNIQDQAIAANNKGIR